MNGPLMEPSVCEWSVKEALLWPSPRERELCEWSVNEAPPSVSGPLMEPSFCDSSVNEPPSSVNGRLMKPPYSLSGAA